MAKEIKENSEFEQQRLELTEKLGAFMAEYDEFTKDVAPKHYRTTGHHFVELRNMKHDIENMTEITAKMRETVETLMR